MDKLPPTLELVPMDGEKPADAPAPPAAARDIVPTIEQTHDAIEISPVERPIPVRKSAPAATPAGDSYAAQAAREYADGKIDQPLWDRALRQANGDATAAAAIYVRARAVALRLFDRDRRPARSSANVAPVVVDDDEVQSQAAWSKLDTTGIWEQYRVAILIGAVALPLMAAGAFWALKPAPALAPAVAVAGAKAANPGAAAPPKVEHAKAVPTDFAKKVEDLRAVGNWNVLVLYAVEWTRKEPTNPAAWDNLRMGYIYLRQYDDALSAATRATQLAPDDARLWRRLGDVNIELDDPANALAAFEQAAARNSADLDSLHQVAMLNARLGRATESKAAFDRAAAASPGDAITACLRNGVAQMPPARDAYTMSRQIRAIDDRCHGRGDNVAAKK